ncbi:MAG: hypothetical protein WBC60_03440 [Cognaticolwellia sp.]
MTRKFFTFIFVYLCCFNAFALGLTISTNQLNSMMNIQFPISQRYMEYTLEASKPNLTLYDKTQSVAISVRINVTNKHYRLIADATFKGQIVFDKTTKSLKVSNPLMTNFDLIDNSFPESQTSINDIESIVGQHLPISVLIDFNQIRSELFQFMPSNLTIVSGGLRVEY